MIRFFREKASIIGWSIIIFFGATMFAGSLFLGFSNRSTKTTPTIIDNNFALLGDLPINQDQYFNYRLQSYQSLKNSDTNITISPEQIENIEYDAFLKALRFTILLEAAKQKKMKVTRLDLNNYLVNIYKQLNIKDKRELKKFLKEKNYPYKLFINNQKKEILNQKMSNFLISQIKITNNDVDNQYKHILSQHILIKTGIQTNLTDIEALEKAEKVYNEIQKGMPFKEAVTLYSNDINSKKNEGKLDWIQAGNVLPEFEEVVFSLNIDEISKPIKSIYGYHIIKVLDIKNLSKPEKIDYKKEKEKLTSLYQERIVTNYIRGIITQSQLIVKNPILKAIHGKVQKNFNDAFEGYQVQISSNPEQTIPHYFIAKLYLAKNELEKAIQELKKAEIKGEINPSLDFGLLHILLGNIYLENAYNNKQFSKKTMEKIEKDYNNALSDYKNKKSQFKPNVFISIIKHMKGEKKTSLLKKVITQYDKAFELSKKDKEILNQLRLLFSDLDDQKRIKKINENIEILEELERAAIPSINELIDIDFNSSPNSISETKSESKSETKSTTSTKNQSLQ